MRYERGGRSLDGPGSLPSKRAATVYTNIMVYLQLHLLLFILS